MKDGHHKKANLCTMLVQLLFSPSENPAIRENTDVFDIMHRWLPKLQGNTLQPQYHRRFSFKGSSKLVMDTWHAKPRLQSIAR